MIFNKGAKSFGKWCWETQIPTCQRMKLEPALIPPAKTNSEWIKELELFNSQNENRKKTSWHWIWQWIPGYDTKDASTKRKNIEKWTSTLKTSGHKDTIRRVKKQPREQGQVFQVTYLIKVSIQGCGFPTVNHKSTYHSTEKWAKDLNRHFPKTYKWPTSTGKDAHHHSSPGKCQLKP